MVFTTPPKYGFRDWSVFEASRPGVPYCHGPFVLTRNDTAVASFDTLDEASAEAMRVFRAEEISRLSSLIRDEAESLDGSDDVKTLARLGAALAVLQVQIDG